MCDSEETAEHEEAQVIDAKAEAGKVRSRPRAMRRVFTVDAAKEQQLGQVPQGGQLVREAIESRCGFKNWSNYPTIAIS